MKTIPDLGTSIEDIDREISTGVNRLRFGQEAERRYERETLDDRTRHLAVASLIGLALYDIFLVSDWQMVGDVFHQAVVVRIGVYTPLALFLIFLLFRRPSSAVRESLLAANGILCATTILWLFSISNDPNRVTYHYGTLIIMLFVTIVQQVRFRFAVCSVVGMLVAQFVAITHCSACNASMIESEITFYLSSAILILLAAYMLEREKRRAYLLLARSHLLHQQLERTAKIDALTGLWNRRHLAAEMEAAWVAAKAIRQVMTVILLDIDHFKSYNDKHGHLDGDRCLQRIADRLQTALNDFDHIAVRFGGEEFLVFLPGVDEAEGYRAARILRQAIRYEAIPFSRFGAAAIVTASFGVATGLTCNTTPSALIAAADASLYAAKAAGRDCIYPRAADEKAQAAVA